MTLEDAAKLAGKLNDNDSLPPSQCLELLAQLPVDLQPIVREMLRGMWGDGFGCGVARLPRKNPCDLRDSERPTQPHIMPPGKKRR